MIEGISSETLLADVDYDANEFLSYVVSAGTESVIPPRKNRKEQRDYGNALNCKPKIEAFVVGDKVSSGMSVKRTVGRFRRNVCLYL